MQKSTNSFKSKTIEDCSFGIEKKAKTIKLKSKNIANFERCISIFIRNAFFVKKSRGKERVNDVLYSII